MNEYNSPAFYFFTIFGFFSGVVIHFLRIRIPQAIIFSDKILLNELLIKNKKAKQTKKFNFFERFWYNPLSLYMGVFMAAVAMLFYMHFNFSIKSLILFIFLSALILLALIDFFHNYLPDIITLPFLWLGIFLQLFPKVQTIGLESSVIGVFMGYLTLFFINGIYFLFRKRNGVGYGDIKLMAMLGSWYGPYPLPSILFLASILGLFWHLRNFNFVKYSSSSSFPFGPYIVLASVFHLFFLK